MRERKRERWREGQGEKEIERQTERRKEKHIMSEKRLYVLIDVLKAAKNSVVEKMYLF